MKHLYWYGMRLRGFSPGAQPKMGFVERRDDPHGKYWDLLAYDHKLSDADCRDYDLDPIYISDPGVTFCAPLAPTPEKYRISADNGKSWTVQLLSEDEAEEMKLSYPDRIILPVDNKRVWAYFPGADKFRAVELGQLESEAQAEKVVHFYNVQGVRETSGGCVDVSVEHLLADGPEEAAKIAAESFGIVVVSVEIWQEESKA